jgi:hypothetical protein
VFRKLTRRGLWSIYVGYRTNFHAISISARVTILVAWAKASQSVPKPSGFGSVEEGGVPGSFTTFSSKNVGEGFGTFGGVGIAIFWRE